MDKVKSDVKLSVVIVSYKCLEYLKQCIESIDAYNDIGDELEVIVADNSPDDTIVEWLKENRPDITAIPNENKGFGYGNNVGAKYAKGEILLFLNPDTILIEPIFKYAVDRFQDDTHLGMFGVLLVNSNYEQNSSYGLRMPLGMLRTLLCNALIKLKIFIPKIMYTSGADIFIRRKAFYDAGCFDENIFMYCEEADLSNRVNAAGYRNGFFRDKKIIHLEGKTELINLYTSYVKVMNSRKYYCEKYKLNYQAYINKELRYCKLKSAIYKMKNNKEISEQYDKIVEFLKSERKV